MRSLRSAAVVVLGVAMACSGKNGNGFGDGTDSGSGDSGGDATQPPTGDGGNPFGTIDSSPGPQGCQYQDSTDHDGDGFSFADGDCNDCDPSANPGAFDVPGNGVDEDCSGTADDEPANCDANLAIASTNAMDGAKAIDLCRTTTENATGKQRTWGVISAKYMLPDGTNVASTYQANFDLGHGLLSHFGADPNKPANSAPQLGKSLLGISSGTARNPNDPGYQSVSGFSKGYTSSPPQGFTPKNATGCSATGGSPHDGSALALTIRVPTNANSFTFKSAFFTYEYPSFVCTTYNDYYVAIMSPAPAKITDGDIVLDQDGNPVSVNNSFLQVCSPGTHGGKTFTCPQGTSMLTGTDFEGHGSTGWLTTTVPVDTLRGKDITLLFAIWDSGDGILDSTSIIDAFQWSVNSATGVTTVPTPN